MILGIDPGTTQSGWCRFDGVRVHCAGVMPNEDLLYDLKTGSAVAYEVDVVAIEMMRARGMPVSNDAMETLVWIGRFQQAWHTPDAVRLVNRADVKLHICGTTKAKDANIRQALIDLLGPQGTKKSPGPTYGVKSHGWPALAVAVTVTNLEGALGAVGE